MKKSKFLLVALLSALTVSGCTFNSSNPVNNSTPVSSVDKASAVIEEIAARIVFLKDKQEVVDDFEVPSVVKFNYEGTNIEVNITWTADKANVTFETVDGVLMGKLNRPEMGQDPVEVKLTASFSYEGKEGSKGFKVKVMPKTGAADVWGVEPTGTVMSWSEFRAAENGSIITVQGRVIAWTYDEAYGNGNVFLQDDNGGYYAYRLVAALSEYQDYLAVGNEVILEGQKDVYSGLHQMAQKSVTGIKVVSRENAGQKPTPKDVTELAKNGGLEPVQSTWVTVLGTYVIGDDGYKYIQVGGNRYQIYSDKKYNGENLDEVNAQLAALTAGDTIRLKGIVGMYTNPQFYPYDVVKSDETITVSPAEKVAIAKADVFGGFKAKYEEAAEVALYASSESDVTITYALNAEANTSVFALGADKLTITPTEAEEKATITATITCGTVTDTASFEITAALPNTNVDSYVLTGESLGLINKYDVGSKKVSGVEWEWTELADYGDGIQMRNKNGKKSSLFNNDATARPIKEIKLTYNSSKTVSDKADAYTFSFGTDATLASYSTQFSFVADTFEYTITPDAEEYTYFKLEYNDSYTYSSYWLSIEIVLADAPETSSATMVSDGSKDYVEAGDTTDYAARLGLNADLFSVTFETNDCTNASGIARLHDTSGIQIYGSNYQANPTTDQGAALIITCKKAGMSIVDVVVTTTGTKGYSVNDSEIITETGEKTFVVNSTTVKVQARATAQTKIASIVINYTGA